MSTDTDVQKFPSLDDEVLARLADENGWLTSHALLQRCDLAPDADRLGEALLRLHRKGQLQRVHGDLGLLYGALGLAVPGRTAVTGAPKLPTLHDLNRAAALTHAVKIAAGAAGVTVTAPKPAVAADEPQAAPPSAALATARNMTGERAAEIVLGLIRRNGRVSAADAANALALSAPATKYHLGVLQKAGQITRMGNTSTAYYVLSEPVEPAVEPAQEPSSAPAVESVAPRASDVWPELRPRLLELLATQPLWRSQDLMPLLGKTANSITTYLARLEDEGTVQRVGRGMATRWALVGAPAAPVPAQRLSPAVQRVTIDQGDFALWSDGTLQIRGEQVDVILAAPAQQALRRYLGGVGEGA